MLDEALGVIDVVGEFVNCKYNRDIQTVPWFCMLTNIKLTGYDILIIKQIEIEICSKYKIFYQLEVKYHMKISETLNELFSMQDVFTLGTRIDNAIKHLK